MPTFSVIKAKIQNRRIDVPAPNDLPDGTEVVLTIGTSVPDDELMAPDEIACVLAAMQQLEPLEIPADTAVDLDAWERQLNQHGIDNTEKGLEEVFP
jgi:hypothetical protein